MSQNLIESQMTKAKTLLSKGISLVAAGLWLLYLWLLNVAAKLDPEPAAKVFISMAKVVQNQFVTKE